MIGVYLGHGTPYFTCFALCPLLRLSIHCFSSPPSVVIHFRFFQLSPLRFTLPPVYSASFSFLFPSLACFCLSFFFLLLCCFYLLWSLTFCFLLLPFATVCLCRPLCPCDSFCFLASSLRFWTYYSCLRNLHPPFHCLQKSSKENIAQSESCL